MDSYWSVILEIIRFDLQISKHFFRYFLVDAMIKFRLSGRNDDAFINSCMHICTENVKTYMSKWSNSSIWFDSIWWNSGEGTLWQFTSLVFCALGKSNDIVWSGPKIFCLYGLEYKRVQVAARRCKWHLHMFTFNMSSTEMLNDGATSSALKAYVS